MEAVCGIAILIALGILATQFRKLISFITTRYQDLPILGLHIRLFIFSVLATLPLLLLAHYLASLDWGGYMPLYPLLYLLGIPLILLGEALTDLLENIFSIHASSLDLLVLDSLLVFQWVLWGQILAIAIRLRRKTDPITGNVDEILSTIERSYRRIIDRYGKRQTDQILGLLVGLIFISLVCLLVIFIIRTEL